MDLEKIIIDIIAFLKRYVKTFYWLLFRPVFVAKTLKHGDRKIIANPTVYLIVNLLMYITLTLEFMRSRDSLEFQGGNIMHLFSTYGKHLSDYSLVQKVLLLSIPYVVIAIVFRIYFFMFRIKDDQRAIRSFCELWIGQSMLIYFVVVFGLYFIVNYNTLYNTIGVHGIPEGKFYFLASAEQYIHIATSYILPIAILGYVFARIFLNPLKSYVAIVVAALCVGFAADLVYDITELLIFAKVEDVPIIVFAPSGNERVPVSYQNIDKDSTRFKINFELIFRNQSESPYIFFSGDSLAIINADSTESLPNNREGWALLKSPFVYSHPVKMDGNEKTFLVLDPGDTRSIEYEIRLDDRNTRKYFGFYDNDFIIKLKAYKLENDRMQSEWHLRDETKIVKYIGFNGIYNNKGKILITGNKIY